MVYIKRCYIVKYKYVSYALDESNIDYITQETQLYENFTIYDRLYSNIILGLCDQIN